MSISPGSGPPSPDPTDRYPSSRDLQGRAHALIPGGCHTYAKGDDQYPRLSPGFIRRGQGCRVWDVDGNEFIEYGMGLRSVVLGHAFPDVLRAVREALDSGSNFCRPSPLEVECAETLLRMVPGAEMVKFAKNGSDATTGAVKLARAFTGREMVAICSDHPFFSTDDWFIGVTAMDAGIPQAIKDLTVSFRYNDLESVRVLFDRFPSQIAALVLEPAATEEPRDGFLTELRRLAHDNGALLVFDEMITGFRWALGGAQALYGVQPDLSAFGKALANGFSASALVGRREIMELGGLRHRSERVFLLSTTHGGRLIPWRRQWRRCASFASKASSRLSIARGSVSGGARNKQHVIEAWNRTFVSSAARPTLSLQPWTGRGSDHRPSARSSSRSYCGEACLPLPSW